MLLSDIVTDICARAGISSSLIDVSEFTTADDVLGYQIPRQMPARTALETLMAAYNFDAVERDWKLYFRKRGSTSVATIAANELRVHRSGDQIPDKTVETRTQDLEIPTHFTLSYESKVRDYEIASQNAVRVDKATYLPKSSALGLVMTDSHAKQQAEIILKQMWVNRHRYGFSTTNKYIKLAPGDVITVSGKIMRVIEMADRDGIIDFVCESEEGGVYSNSAVADDLTFPVDDLTDAAFIPSFIGMDIPPLDPDAPSVGLTFAMYGITGYSGGTIEVSYDGGATYSEVVYFNSTTAKVGTCTDTLDDFTGVGLDAVSTVTVDLTISASALTSTLQTAIVGSVTNGWEILQFETATLVSGNTYTLSNFYRGLYGTENEIAGHGAGEMFVLVTLENGVDFFSANPTEAGNTYLFRAKNSSDAVGEPVSYTIGSKMSDFVLTIANGINRAVSDVPTLSVA
jgi:hypothetical protein